MRSVKEGKFRGYWDQEVEREVIVGNSSPNPYFKKIVG